MVLQWVMFNGMKARHQNLLIYGTLNFGRVRIVWPSSRSSLRDLDSAKPFVTLLLDLEGPESSSNSTTEQRSERKENENGNYGSENQCIRPES